MPELLAQQILEACVDAGGSITGEHGVGTDKACAMPLMFSEDDLAAMKRLRSALRSGRSRESRASSSRRRGSAARCRGRTAPTRSNWRALQSASEHGIVEHEPGDLTCIVEARHPALGARRPRSRAHGQRLSLDPPGDPTLAECLLDDLSGPLRHRFGTMRDLVIGVTVVLPDGTRAHSGGKVVKNVAGYDLGKLFCGSRGRLGTVERLALRLHPLPAAARTIVARRRALARRCTARRLVPSAVDVADDRMYVLFEGAPQAVAEQADALGGERGRAVGGACARCRPACPAACAGTAGAAPLVRPGPRVAYVETAEPAARGARSPNASLEALCSPS